jgi:hypothetical protein
LTSDGSRRKLKSRCPGDVEFRGGRVSDNGTDGDELIEDGGEDVKVSGTEDFDGAGAGDGELGGVVGVTLLGLAARGGRMRRGPGELSFRAIVFFQMLKH